jgi:hypothetical protein
MSTQTEREGGCQCGQIRYRITGEPAAVVVCHCSECQRQSGSAFSMSVSIPRDAFSILKGTMKSFARLSDAGRPMAGFFCPECGTRIYHASEVTPDVVRLKAGTLDDTAWLAPTMHFWTRSKQPWFEVPSNARAFETQPQR